MEGSSSSSTSRPAARKAGGGLVSGKVDYFEQHEATHPQGHPYATPNPHHGSIREDDLREGRHRLENEPATARSVMSTSTVRQQISRYDVRTELNQGERALDKDNVLAAAQNSAFDLEARTSERNKWKHHMETLKRQRNRVNMIRRCLVDCFVSLRLRLKRGF